MRAADGHEEVKFTPSAQARHLILRSRALARRFKGWTDRVAILRDAAKLVIGPAKPDPLDAAPQDEAYCFSGSLGGTGDDLLPAVAPPSIGSVMPVTQRDSSLARYNAP
jgi:hypothetical protein